MALGRGAMVAGRGAGTSPANIYMMIGLIDGVTPALRNIQRNTLAWTNSMQTHQSKWMAFLGPLHTILDTMDTIGMVSLATVGVMAGGYAVASRASLGFEQQLVNMNSILMASDEVMWQLGERAVALSTQYNKSADDIAAGMYHLACCPATEFVLSGDYRAHHIGDYDGSDGMIGSEGKLVNVKSYMNRDCEEGRVFEIKPRMLRPFRVTGNHPIYAIKSKPCKPCRALGSGNSAIKLWKPSCSTRERETCTKLYYKDYRPEWVRTEELEIGDILLYPKIKDEKEINLSFDIGPHSKLKAPKVLDKDFSFFLGLILGDGWAETHTPYVSCAFSDNDESTARWYESYIKKLGYKPSRYSRDGCFVVRFYSEPINKFITEEIDKGAENKRIPPFMFEANKECVKAFLKGYISSDGCLFEHKANKNTPRISITTVSPHIAYFINLLASKIDVIFSITYDDKKKNGRTHRHMPSGYYCELKDTYFIQTENSEFINRIL
ncbi:MAG: hypothetical protein KAS32_07230, partial [Candidatus Peribacteraceae bacterium]|nr:hypothetical protein [Candidatus Peribacteraceae bacterium]